MGGSRTLDRDDARFVIDALESRIAGDRDALDRLAASSLVRLHAAAMAIKRVVGRSDARDVVGRSAHLCAVELEAICRYGGGAANVAPDPSINIFVDKLRQLADEPVQPVQPAMPRNRLELRTKVSGKTLARQRRANLRALGQRAPV